MDLAQVQSEKQKQYLKDILFCNRNALSQQAILNALNVLENLCQQRATIKVQKILCKFCKMGFRGSDENYIISGCELQQQHEKLFHKNCFLSYCLTYNNKSCMKNCNNNQCKDKQQQQMNEIFKVFEHNCAICNQNLNDQQKYVPTGCDCPFKKVHKECLIKKFCNFNDQYYRFKCKDCDQYYREENVLSAIQNNLLGCTKCHDSQSNHAFWECVFLDCFKFVLCRNCFSHEMEKIDFDQKQINQIECFHGDCGENISFHTLNDYFFKKEKAYCETSDQILQKYKIDLRNFFKVAECPGSIFINKRDKQKYQYIQQQTHTHFIKYNTWYHGDTDMEDLKYQDDWELKKCDFKFEANNKPMQRCPNCNYNFCVQCRISHVGISCCTAYNQIKEENKIDGEFDLDQNRYGQNLSDPLGIKNELNLVNKIFNQDQTQELFSQNNDLFKVKQKPYYFTFPLNYTQTLELNVEFLSGKQYSFFNNYLIIYLPISNLNHLRQVITCGVENNIPLSTSEMIDKFTGKLIQNGVQLYSVYEHALEMSQNIQLSNGKIVKILVVCKTDPDKVKLPLSYQNIYIANQMSTTVFQILVFSQN